MLLRDPGPTWQGWAAGWLGAGHTLALRAEMGRQRKEWSVGWLEWL